MKPILTCIATTSLLFVLAGLFLASRTTAAPASPPAYGAGLSVPAGKSASGPVSPMDTPTATPTPGVCEVLNYTYTISTGAAIVPGTTNIGNHCDDCTTLITLPFSYRLYEQNFTTANVSSNGSLQFSSTNTAYSNTCLPNPLFNYTIFAYWDDLTTADAASGEGIFTSVSGTAPNRIFNIEWRAVHYGNVGPPSLVFEVRLYEGQSRFDIIYGTLSGNTGLSATVGVQKATGSLFTQFGCNTGGLSNGLRLSFTRPPSCVTATPSGTPTPTPIVCEVLNYTYTVTTGATIVPGTTDIDLHCDHCARPVALPFAYTLYEHTFNSVNLSSSGTLQFLSADTSDSYSCLPHSTFNYAILPYWNPNLEVYGGFGGHGIFTSISGTAPNRIFNIEWRAGYIPTFGPLVNFEVRLYEGQNRFDIIYGRLDAYDGLNPTVGVQKDTGSLFTQYQCSTNTLSTGLKLTFTRPPACITGTPTVTRTSTITPTPTTTPTITATPCSVVTILNEGFESGLGNFTSVVDTCVPGGCGWNLYPATQHSGVWSAFAPNLANISDQSLELSTDFGFPANVSSAVLSFWHLVDLENIYDGGVLEFSTDSGATWSTSNPIFITGGYNGTIDSGYGNPLAGRQAWTGTIGTPGTFVQVQVDLSAYIGASHPLRFRFRQGNDDQAAAAGWWIDDVQLYANYQCYTFTPTRTPTLTYTPTLTPTPTNPACGPGSNYVVATATATRLAGETDTGNHCDDCLTAISLPFPISLYGVQYNSAQVSSNGQIAFTTGNTVRNNTCLPNAAASNVIFVHWDDLMTNAQTNCAGFQTGCGIFTAVTGAVGNRIFAVEWRAVYFPNGDGLSFEALFREDQPNSFELYYGYVPNAGVGATIGVQRDTGSLFTQYECNTGGITSGLLLRFTQPLCVTSTPTPTATNTPTITSTSTFTASPTATATPPSCGPGSNYVFATSTATIIPGNTDSGNHCDDCLTTISLPFSITLYATQYNSAQVSSNGQMDFTTGDPAYINTCLPDASASNAIFPHWDDLMTDGQANCSAYPTGCGIFTAVTGTVGSRVFVVEWRAVYFPNGVAVNFEVVFRESQPGTFDLVYGNVPNTGTSATIGVQRDTGSLFTQFECNTGGIAPGMQMAFFQVPCATPTSMPTNTSIPTSTPATLLVGHVTWQGRPAQPNTLQQVPITLTLKSGTTEMNYSPQTTDASGYFTVSLAGLSNGTYNWRAKGTKWLATSGSLALSGASVTQQEMGMMLAGDCNNDNTVSVSDFNILKNTFGKSQGDAGYDDRADFTGELTVSISDFNLMKSSFGQSGTPPMNPLGR